MFGPQMWQTISLDPELRPFMDDKEFVQKVKMLNANPKIKKVFEKLMGMSFPSGNPDDDKKDCCDDKGNCSEDVTMSEPKVEKQKEPTPEPEPELSEEEKKQKEEELRIANEALSHKQAGNEFYKNKQYKEAIAEYQKAQSLDAKKASYVLNESAALFMMEEWDATIACCERAIKVSQVNFDDLKWCFKAYCRMGSVEEKRNNIKQAVEYYKKAMVEKNDDKIRKKVRKMEQMEKKKAAQALVDPELAEKLKQEGNAFFGKAMFAEAIEKYSEAIKRNPKDHKIYSNRATAFCKLMRWDAALADCDVAIGIDPLFVKAYIRKGKIQHCLKQYHKALDAYKQAEAIDGTVEDLIIAKRDTMIAIQQRNASGAISDEEKARAMQDPDVQNAMNDPEVSSVLLQAQSGDPTILYKAMRDRPHIKDKIEMLMAAGVLRLG